MEVEAKRIFEEFERLGQRLDSVQAQVNEVETRLSEVEPKVAEIPSLKSYMGRMESMVLLIQSDVARMKKSAEQHNQEISNKLDKLLAFLQPKAVIGPEPK